MKKYYGGIAELLILIAFLVLLLFIQTDYRHYPSLKKPKPERVRSTSSPKAAVESKKARTEYFFRMLRDPATNQIPGAIRQRELEYAKMLQKHASGLNKTSLSFTWKEAGPNDVGGRTRALAVDVTNPNTILAGGVSGGMWKSTDNGMTWKIKSTTTQILSVSSIAQDKRPDFTNNWYYVCGEYPMSSACAPFAPFSGDGVYKSTDNGESWFVLPGTMDNNFAGWNNQFDFCLKIVVTQKGSILIATASSGIYRSGNGGNTFQNVLGDVNEHVYSDVVETANGVLIAAISTAFQGYTSKKEPGIYKSADDGLTWAKITPATFPASHMRSVIAAVPSNPDIVYILTDVGEPADGRDDVRFHKINLKTGASEDRSANLPGFNKDKQGIIYTQDCYNLMLAVKPDDENLVIIGATSLFRSMDAFSAKQNDARINWIGGYHETQSGWMFYPGLHPDIHAFAFDPANPGKVWFGHDGGLSYTADITNTDYEEFFPWENKNNSYNVTQFYMVAFPDDAYDNRIMGGTQDNGTPCFTFDGNVTSKSMDVSSGDGAWAYFGKQFAFASAQTGWMVRYRYTASGEIDGNSWTGIYPKEAKNQLFINPYAVDPSNEDVIYYPAGNVIWRNRNISSIPDGVNGTQQGWEQMAAVSIPEEFLITSIGISKNNPAGTLYYAAFSYGQNPKLYKLENARTAFSGAEEISIPQAAAGSYIHYICVNPDDGNEILAVMSNYNIIGLFHSKDGGQTYTAVEGNLIGNSKYPGPSLRGASILTTEKGKVYLLATSIGVFSATSLDGGNTAWKREGAVEIGNTIVNFISSRKSDGKIVAGTHGRGIFLGAAEATAKALAIVNVSSLRLEVNVGQTASSAFTLGNKGGADLNFNISASGNKAGKQQQGEMSPQSFTGLRAGLPVEKQKLSMRNLHTERMGKNNNSLKLTGTDLLILDDGNNSADTFYGYGSNAGLSFANEFDVSGFDFLLDGIQVFIRSEDSPLNGAGYGVLDDSLNLIYYGFKALDKSSGGAWYTLPIDTSFLFKNGHRFFLLVEAGGIADYPAGFDNNAKVKNKSYYKSLSGSDLVNMNSIEGAENGAFLIRATGTKFNGGGGNQIPVAVDKISTGGEAKVNETITFDASGSYDPDGQIASYLWTFGDGAQSDQKIATHAYTQPGTYKIGLKVTDNKGAAGEKTGQVVISASGETLKFTVSPSAGTLAPGASQTVTLNLNAEGLTVGNYTGVVAISGNGGNIQIPVQVTVFNALMAKEEPALPVKYELLQNYPNPFNPETLIRFSLPEAGHVTLNVYDVNGREVIRLLDDFKNAGEYGIRFNALKLSSGVYYYSISSGKYTAAKKMVYIK